MELIGNEVSADYHTVVSSTFDECFAGVADAVDSDEDERQTNNQRATAMQDRAVTLA